MYPGNKSLRLCCVIFYTYFLTGVLHYVEFIYEFLSTQYIDYALYWIFFAKYFILNSPCPLNREFSVLLFIVVLIFSTITFSGAADPCSTEHPSFNFLTVVCRHLVGILEEEAAFPKVSTNIGP